MTKRLVLMAKPPHPGVAKTRLARSIGDEAAAQVAEALLLDTVALCERLAAATKRACPARRLPPPSADLLLAYTHDRGWFERHLSTLWYLVPQRGEGLDQRLDCALADLGVGPDDATVFLGMDAPHLPPERLAEAFESLRSFDTVLGPCDDGGYYLVGVRGRWPRGTLREVRWSTERACADTLEALRVVGLSCALLAQSYDVDDLCSLRRLAGECASGGPEDLVKTRSALASLPCTTWGEEGRRRSP